ncbi:glycoside hydrolase family 43 protein [Dothistroma septosporum NZE10]|uniref:Glycoside hydrolase family 43 protein n=1 Tax=Dothistroma septosporum (strain NZE10 / CBS 128990) TaxID=675120 RepID=N1PFB1_DOTSN|nr:glycoside hydrolase family 43 protein [Dothistroma septosporum NZE10]
MLLLAGIIATAVALSLAEHHRIRAVGQGPDRRSAPIRLAIASNFPDPGLWYDNGTYYAFATTNAAGVLRYPSGKPSNASEHTVNFGLANVQMATSRNFVDWTVAGLNAQPLPAEGKWTRVPEAAKVNHPSISSTWAPAIIRRADGKFVMYYSAAPGFRVHYRVNHPHPHCLGAAVSTDESPAGPYEPLAESIACPWEQGGAIDPEAFRDPKSGRLYLVYKIDGNNIGSGGACGNTFFPIEKTPIMLQEMEEDGLTKVGDPVEILTNEKQDGPLVEAPVLVQTKEGIYFLFFSSGCTRLPTYALEYATATNITGPYTRVKDKLLKTGDWGLEAPGSVGISEDGKGGWSMAFHARVNDGDIGRVRAMFTTKLKFEGRSVSMMRDNDTVTLRHHHYS